MNLFSLAAFHRFIFHLTIALLGLGLKSSAAQRVIRDQLTARWTEDGQRFWYEIRNGQGSAEFWFVDARQLICRI
jgi:hypothetical protein